MPGWFQHLPSAGWEKRKSKNDSWRKRGRANERKRCLVRAQHLNECVFLGMLAAALKHENEHRLWHLGITVLRMDNPQARLPSRRGCKAFSQSERANWTFARIGDGVCCYLCILWPHSHPRWTKWGPWVLSEMHNKEETLHIVQILSMRVPGAFALVYHVLGVFSCHHKEGEY